MVVFLAILSFPPNMTVTWFMANSSDSVTARDPALSYAMLTGRRRAVSFELDQTCLKSNQLISSRWKWKDVIIHNWSLYFALRDFLLRFRWRLFSASGKRWEQFCVLLENDYTWRVTVFFLSFRLDFFCGIVLW